MALKELIDIMKYVTEIMSLNATTIFEQKEAGYNISAKELTLAEGAELLTNQLLYNLKTYGKLQ